MDPNACLIEILDALAKLHRLRDSPANDRTDTVEEAVNHMKDLSLWLTNGGSPPKVFLNADELSRYYSYATYMVRKGG